MRVHRFVITFGIVVVTLAPVVTRAAPQTGAPQNSMPGARTIAQLARILNDGGTVVLHDVLFEIGKSAIRPKSGVELDGIGAVLKNVPPLKLEIRGRTDVAGGKPGSLALSQARAEAVRDYLIKKFGIASDRLTAIGVADAAPVADAARVGKETGVIEFVKARPGESASGKGGSANAPQSEWTGRLTTGMMAIGGETTGITLSTGRDAYELQPATDAIRQRLQELNGKTATVRGRLDERPGVEVRTRRIITVTEVTAR
jgi:outer membrane protein OmpA-like peptidoglycan-associated protein